MLKSAGTRITVLGGKNILEAVLVPSRLCISLPTFSEDLLEVTGSHFWFMAVTSNCIQEVL